jgi:hypothetical protein
MRIPKIPRPHRKENINKIIKLSEILELLRSSAVRMVTLNSTITSLLMAYNYSKLVREEGGGEEDDSPARQNLMQKTIRIDSPHVHRCYRGRLYKLNYDKPWSRRC